MVRLLTPSDAEEYAALRMRMLVDTPWSFVSSPGHDHMGSVEQVRRFLERPDGAIAGAFDGPSLAAVVGLRREDRPKRRHVAWVWGVYTRPESRRRGLSRAALTLAIETAKSWPGVDVLLLGVSEHAPEARALYTAIGFTVYGHEPDCVRVDGRSYAEDLMRLPLTR